LEIVEATFHRRWNQYGGMKADDVKQLKELQVENGRLKKLVAPSTSTTSGRTTSSAIRRRTVGP